MLPGCGCFCADGPEKPRSGGTQKPSEIRVLGVWKLCAHGLAGADPHRNGGWGKAMLGSRIQNKQQGDANRMSSSNRSNSNQPVVPNAREALNKFKMEAASDLRVPVPS